MIMSQNMPRDSTRINYDDFEMSSHSSHSSRSYSAEVDAFLPLSGSQLLDAGANSASPLNLTFPIAKSFSHFSNSFLSNSFKLPTFLSKPSAIVVVDPWSTGNRLCHEIANREITLIVLWNHNQIRSTNLPSKEVILHNKADYNATVSQLTFLSKSLYDIKAIIPGSETGVLLAEQLSNTLTYPTNDLNLTQARRNKYLMGETLRSKGVRAVKQTITTDFNEALAFIKTELIPLMEDNKLRVILKPNMGAGSDDVFLCKTFEEIEKNFNIINGKINSLGLKNDGVLVQEYLDGKEYVIDSVTKNGKHKIVAIWEYDKREVNDRFNIYFGNFPLVKKPTCEITPKLEKYIMEVLNALEFKNGPSHAEIKMTAKSGPCLVEIGARCHGGGGTWVDVAKAVWGFDQISHLIDSIHFSQSSETFDAFHNQGFPTEFKKFGCVLDFIGYQTGQIVDIPGEQKVKSLKSFFKLELFKKVGDELELTVDCNTSPGQLILIHDSEEQVRKDYQTVHDLLVQNNGFFAIKQNN